MRSKSRLDNFWLRDESLEDGANLPDPGIIAAEIVEDLRAALEEFELISADLEKAGAVKWSGRSPDNAEPPGPPRRIPRQPSPLPA